MSISNICDGGIRIYGVLSTNNSETCMCRMVGYVFTNYKPEGNAICNLRLRSCRYFLQIIQEIISLGLFSFMTSFSWTALQVSQQPVDNSSVFLCMLVYGTMDSVVWRRGGQVSREPYEYTLFRTLKGCMLISASESPFGLSYCEKLLNLDPPPCKFHRILIECISSPCLPSAFLSDWKSLCRPLLPGIWVRQLLTPTGLIVPSTSKVPR